MKSVLGWAVLAVLASGCGGRISYVVMRSSLADPGREDRPEITSTTEAANVIPRVRRVALRAPDACASQSAAETTGAASNRGSIVQTDCGVEMAELERALTRAGYQVFSWKQIQSMGRQMPAEEAARQLGAEVLFQVNSLERVSYVPSRFARWDRAFYASNPQGQGGQPFSFHAHELAQLEPMLARVEQNALTSLGVMLDVNAVFTETGQTVWFYRRVRFASPSIEASVLLRRTKAGWEWTAPGSGQVRAAPQRVAQQSRPVASSANRDLDAAYFELMRGLVGEFAGTFAQSGGLQQVNAGPPPPPPFPAPL